MTRMILIVDDDRSQRAYLEAAISGLGYNARTASGGAEAIELLAGAAEPAVDLVLLDLMMPGVDGMDVLTKVVPRRPNLPFVVLTSKVSVATVVEAMRAGAADYVVKPAGPERLQISIDNAIKVATLSGEVSRLSRRAANRMGIDDLVANSQSMRRALELAQRAAASKIPILIEGESGVGKEVIAHAIQGNGDRAGGAFITVNCGAIPENLVESILFGHDKGAFTGATERRSGKFLDASGGTLFLDEVGELKPAIQVKLLRALQDGEIDPVGGRKTHKVDVRLISATNRGLAGLVAQGQFREDLYYRLNVFPIVVPPLRSRREDIAPLASRFLASYAATEGKSITDFGPGVLDLITAHHWPGNVRELENAIFRAVVLSDGPRLEAHDFPTIGGSAPRDALALVRGRQVSGGQDGALGVPIRDAHGELRALRDVEGEMINAALARYNGHMAEVARRLGIGRSTLYRKVRELGIEVEEKRAAGWSLSGSSRTGAPPSSS